MHCSHCGGEIAENEKFCSHCGSAIELGTQTGPQPASPQPNAAQLSEEAKRRVETARACQIRNNAIGAIFLAILFPLIVFIVSIVFMNGNASYKGTDNPRIKTALRLLKVALVLSIVLMAVQITLLALYFMAS